jgi:hypothetical protein
LRRKVSSRPARLSLPRVEPGSRLARSCRTARRSRRSSSRSAIVKVSPPQPTSPPARLTQLPIACAPAAACGSPRLRRSDDPPAVGSWLGFPSQLLRPATGPDRLDQLTPERRQIRLVRRPHPGHLLQKLSGVHRTGSIPATGRCRCLPRSAARSPGCATPSPMAAMPASNRRPLESCWCPLPDSNRHGLAASGF